MEFGLVKVNLGGDRNNEAVLSRVTPSELYVLKQQHKGMVELLEVSGDAEVNNKALFEMLFRKYKKARQFISQAFPGLPEQKRMFKTFSEIEVKPTFSHRREVAIAEEELKQEPIFLSGARKEELAEVEEIKKASTKKTAKKKTTGSKKTEEVEI